MFLAPRIARGRFRMPKGTGKPGGKSMSAEQKGDINKLALLTQVLQVAFYLLAAIAAVEFITSLAIFSMPARLKTPEAIAAGAGSTLNAVFEGAFRGELIVAGITAILFLVWVYVAKANTLRLGATGLKVSPAWAVAWYLIPIANFWKPCQTMDETWQASADSANWSGQKVGATAQRWSFLWLAGVVAWLFLAREGGKQPSPEQSQMLGVAMTISVAVHVAFFVATAQVIQEIYKLQVEAWRRRK
jgi:hypothetical protein